MRKDRFTGKTCVVTGGASGIGAAAVKGFMAEGGQVVVLDRNAPSLAGVRSIVTDVSSKASIDAAFAQLDAVHVLVNSAGVIGKSTLKNMTEQEWDRVLDANLKGTVFCTQAA